MATPTAYLNPAWTETDLVERCGNVTDRDSGALLAGGDLYSARVHIRALQDERTELRSQIEGLSAPPSAQDVQNAALGRRVRASYISLGCSVDGAVAYVGVCSDAAEQISQYGNEFETDDHLETIADWCRENGYGERDYVVDLALSVRVTASSADAATEDALEQFYSVPAHLRQAIEVIEVRED